MATLIQLDQQVPTVLPRLRWWHLTLTAALSGLAGGLVATVAQASAEPAPASHEVRFEVKGPSSGVAVVARPGGRVEAVPVDAVRILQGPAAIALTVRSISGSEASCRIWIDDALADEEFASGGGAATCVASLD